VLKNVVCSGIFCDFLKNSSKGFVPFFKIMFASIGTYQTP
jgi:hypothetical protein